MKIERDARRFTAHHPAKVGLTPQVGKALGLPATHLAVTDGRSLFPSTVVTPEPSRRVLISGINQRKIGAAVHKGRWRGMPIFCLTLEERATCPTSCAHWRDCYGNGMPFARRNRPGVDLIMRLTAELHQLQAQHPTGFVVRLHILGDFYSTAYVAFWRRALRKFPALRIFGYTAHDPIKSDIGRAVDDLNHGFGDRVWLRFSGAQPAPWAYLSAETIYRKPEGPTVAEGIVCPAQTGQTPCCGTCGLCWTTQEPIAFLPHGQMYKQPIEPPQPYQREILKHIDALEDA